jgi:hypothetical protein
MTSGPDVRRPGETEHSRRCVVRCGSLARAGNLDGMGSPARSRAGAAAVAVVLLLAAGCSSSSANGSASERLGSADEQWVPDLNSDGDQDAMILAGSEVSFAVADGDDLVDVTDEDGDLLVVSLDDRTTVTCQDEGAIVQTFEPPKDDSSTGPLRLLGLDIDGSTGVLTPNPSFFFGPDFELPRLGQGCPVPG